MSEKTNVSLFFIKSPEAKMTAIETFLNKRNYIVTIESDLKIALMKIIETQPDFVFIALDHPNSKVASLHQIINQSLFTNIIHYVNSSAKDDVRKLNYGNFDQKMFPPISGPAIERLVLKMIKEKDRLDQQDVRDIEAQQKKSTLNNTKEEMIQVKSKAAQNLESLLNDDTDSENFNEADKKSKHIAQIGSKKAKIKARNDFLSQSEKKSFSKKQKSDFQNHFESQVKSQLTDVLETYYPDHSYLDNEVEKKDFDQSERFSQIEQEDNKKAFCLPVQSVDWSGYLLAYTNVNLEYQLIEPIFKNWLTQHFGDLTEEEISQSVELEVDQRQFKTWVQSQAEHFEKLTVNRLEILIGFVGVDPLEFKLKINDEHDLIEIDLDIIPVEIDLNLSLHLHLPDNKKFLLYTPLNQKLSPLQKQRLIDKKIEKLFTPADFEKEIRKLKTKNHLNKLFENLKKETSV